MIPVYIEDLGILTARNKGKKDVLAAILGGERDGLNPEQIGEMTCHTARCSDEEAGLVETCGKSNDILSFLTICCREIDGTVREMISRYGSSRIAVVLGTSGYGSDEAYFAEEQRRKSGSFPSDYQLAYQQVHYPTDFVRDYFGTDGYCGTLATACASGAGAIVEGYKLLQAGLADAVIAGGVDNISESVLKGFISLEAVDQNKTIPFSRNRHGINIGEGAALLVLTKEKPGKDAVLIAGFGECSDAHHQTAPDPTGEGAAKAMRMALEQAGMDRVDYINLHGTGTALNDSMEGKATAEVFPGNPFCSSTKAVTGHTLGASGAIELGLCYLLLTSYNPEKKLPPHIWDGEADPDIPGLNFCGKDTRLETIGSAMSNSYAFGGWDVSIIVKKGEKDD